MRWISTLVLCTLLWCIVCSPVNAALSQARFFPCIEGIESNKGTTRYYSVQSGDNLWNISRKFGIGLRTLMVSNSLNERSVLKVGQRLIIPSGQQEVHIIKQGETFWDIARHYNIKLDELEKLNPDKKAHNLKIGEKINLPRGVNGPVVAANTIQPSRSVFSRFSWPIKGSITSSFGSRSSGFHHGLDIAGNLGDAVRASAGGVISYIGYKAVYGNTVIIDHSNDMQTLYAHLNSILVSPGDRVAGGTLIGTVGNTGRSTGPHLHFEVRRDNKAYDPLTYLR
ncbi:MAG: peptidoglycan DD-metalloendopeptidase family protein [Syntrophomonadaceae bacterium]|jgi:murein DD-endopeptidase MepM/ murein hydrolase activator NlpD